MFLSQTVLRSLAGIALGVFLSILLPGKAAASDNERYKAVPLGPNGAAVLILDTREGDMWTWTNQGEQVSPSGENPQIQFQGNLRKNIRSTPLPLVSSQPSERY